MKELTTLRQWILTLSPRTEFLVVVVVAFGYFVIDSILRFLGFDAAPYFLPLSLRGLIVAESSLLAMVGLFLHLRGWRLSDFGRPPSLIQLILGIPLALAAYALYYAIWLILVAPDIESLPEGSPLRFEDLNLRVILSAAVVNSIFEEVLVVGYVMTTVRRRFGSWTAVHVSALIRLAYHVHQGTAAVLSILPMGYVFAYWYARRQSLLPLIVAHAILDVVAYSLLDQVP